MENEIVKTNEEPIKAVYNRNPDGTFGSGNSANPLGRPKGQSLKEYDRENFAKMTPEEKEEFLKTITPEMRYRMAEGNPAIATDITSKGEKLIVMPSQLIEKNDSNPKPSDNSEGHTPVQGS